MKNCGGLEKAIEQIIKVFSCLSVAWTDETVSGFCWQCYKKCYVPLCSRDDFWEGILISKILLKIICGHICVWGVISVSSLQNAGRSLYYSTGRLWTVGKQQEWVTSTLPNYSQLRAKGKIVTVVAKCCGRERLIHVFLLKSASETLYRRDKNKRSSLSAQCCHPESEEPCGVCCLVKSKVPHSWEWAD